MCGSFLILQLKLIAMPFKLYTQPMIYFWKKLTDEILFNFISKHKLRKLKRKQANKQQQKPNTYTHTSLDHLQLKMTLQNSSSDI